MSDPECVIAGCRNSAVHIALVICFSGHISEYYYCDRRHRAKIGQLQKKVWGGRECPWCSSMFTEILTHAM